MHQYILHVQHRNSCVSGRDALSLAGLKLKHVSLYTALRAL
jgi:hypothetical protein